MSDLPSGWTQTTLGEIADTTLGKMLDRGKSQGGYLVPYLRNSNVQWGHIDLDDVLTMDIPLEEQEFFSLQPGDLLVCEGGEIGRCAIWPGGSAYMAFQIALHRVRPHGGIAAKFILYLLEYLSTTGILLDFATGSTIKHLPQERLRRLPVSLPPLDEQRRIVATLEDHLSRWEVGVRNLLATDNRVNRLWQSALNRVVTGEAATPKWEHVATVGEVAEVQGGIQKQPKRKPVQNKYPFLRVANVPRGSLDLAEVHEVELFEGELDRYRLRVGDLLVVEGNGSAEQIGRAAMWRDEIADCVHQNHLIRVRPGTELDPYYLELVWNAQVTAEQLRRAASSTSGLYTLSTAKIKSVQIPVPPRRVQEALAAEADRIRSQIVITRNAVGQSRKRAAALRRSLLMEAFSGKLVTQDPEDLPASLLLERVRAERAAQPWARRGRGMARHVPQEETLI